MHYALCDESGNDQKLVPGYEIVLEGAAVLDDDDDHDVAELVPGFEIVLESAAVVDEDLGNLRESELVSV